MNNTKKNLIYQMIYQILAIFVPLITAPYIARTLGAEQIGEYTYYNTVAQYLGIFIGMGTITYGTREIALKNGNNNKIINTFHEIFSLQIYRAICVIGIYIASFFLFDISNRLLYSLQIMNLLSIMLDISWIFFGIEEFKITVIRNSFVKIISAISIFAFIKDQDDIYLYTLISVLSTLISNICLNVIAIRRYGFRFKNFSIVKKHLKPDLILFLPVIAVSLFRYMDKIMIGILSDRSQLGLYENTEKIMNIPLAIIMAYGTVMMPKLSALFANCNEEYAKNKSKELYQLSMNILLIFSVGAMFGLIGISKDFIPFFLGNEFIPCILMICIYSLFLPITSANSVLKSQYLLPNHLEKINIIALFISAGVNLVFNFFMIPLFGANGAVVGTLLAEFSLFLIQGIYIIKKKNIFWYFVKYSPYFLFGLIMMFVLNLLSLLIKTSDVFKLIIEVVCGGILYCLLVVAWNFISKDNLSTVFVHTINKIKQKLKKKQNKT